MNLVTLAIAAFMALSILFGLYKGFLGTLSNTIALLISLVIAFFCYPLVSSWIAGHQDWLEMIIYFSEGSSHIPTRLLEYGRTGVESLAMADVATVIAESGFTAPFDQYLLSNVQGRVYATQLLTLNDYFDQTIADATLNIVSFVLCAAVSYIIASILVIFIDETFRFPQLRYFDIIAGGLVGALRGYVILMALFMLVPLVVNLLQIGFINDMVQESSLATWFLPKNWFFSWVTPYV